MNLEESDIFKEEIEKNSKHKKSVMFSIIICVIIIIILIALIAYIRYVDSRTLKLYVDNQQKSIASDLFYIENGKKYVNLNELSSLLGYNYTKGIYTEYTEDEDSCYMSNNFETVAISSGKNSYEKYITIVSDKEKLADIKVVSKSKDDGYYERFVIKEPAQFVKGNIYILEDYIPKMFNVALKWTEYRIYFYTLEYQIISAQKSITKLGYTEMNGYYENLRAISDGYAIVGNGNKVYGVLSLAEGREIISIKYDDIKYVQNTDEFFVTVADGRMGLMDSKGKTLIAPTKFEEISLLDEENQLYLVKENGEYGVLNRSGETIIYSENDAVGYDISEFDKKTITNQYLWFNKCIPVEKNGKFGLFDKKTIEANKEKTLLPINYEGFGYVSKESKSSGNEESVLLIPESVGIEGIVIKYNDLYGIYDINEERIILTCVFTKIYSVTKSGETTYYAEYNGEEINLKDYLEENNLANIKNKKITNNDSDEDAEEDTDENDARSDEIEETNTLRSKDNTVINNDIVEDIVLDDVN